MVLITGAMASVIMKLGKLLSDEVKLQKGVRKKIQTLTRDLESMHAALRKAAEVPPNQLDDEVKLWARDVRELSYNVEDILDTFLVHVDSRDEGTGPNKLKHAAKKIGKLFSKSKAHHKIAGMISSINEQAVEVAERHRRYRADDIVAKPATTSTVDPRLAALFRELSQLVGIDKSRGELMSMLSSGEGSDSDGSSNEKMKIVSVVGAGGLGKTTLARTVYESLRHHFVCGAFVPVGQNPDLKKVLRDILIDLDKNVYINLNMEKLDERQLIKELREFLGNKRYFIVIDDIWEPQSWETIKLALAENSCGCRIIITTRKFEVAKEAGELYKLQPLSYDNSKRLFYTRLFGGEDKCPNNHPDELSNQILKKCGGVPLAIITMASLLLGKSREKWTEVCSSPGFYQDKDDRQMENTMHILSLSYYDLPSHLKTCLLYLSVFPEDSLILKDSLIWKWIAEGFVEMKPGRWSFEVGEEYFHDLINRSMIQGVDSWNYGIVYGCRVHDMVLDLILSKSKEENFVSHDGTLSQSQARRLAPKNRELDLTQDTDVKLPQVRSFIVLECHIAKWALHPRLKLIRVLHLEDSRFREGCHRLECIGNLLHLRYLGLRLDINGPVQPAYDLPEGIGALKFLQTLNLEGTIINELPCSIGRLTQLVCLRATWFCVPVGVIRKLTSLEELKIEPPGSYDVDGGERQFSESQRQFLKDLGNLCELRVLDLSYSHGSRKMDERMEIDLVQSLGNLQKMQHLDVPYGDPSVTISWDAAVPSRDLRSFRLPDVRFNKVPSWINSDYLHLSHLSINVHRMDEQGFKALGGLPELCFLTLRMPATETMTSNTELDGCFQKLRFLLLPYSIVQFASRSRTKDDCRQVPAVVVMPKLEKLDLCVDVVHLMENRVASCAYLGLECLPLLCNVKVQMWCHDAFEDDVERELAALVQAVQGHPNNPKFRLRRTGKSHMKRRSDDDDDPVQPRNEEDKETREPRRTGKSHMKRRSDDDDDPVQPRNEEDKETREPGSS